MTLDHLSAVTFAVADMRRSVRFYTALGFQMRYGGEDAAFTSFAVGSSYLNLDFRPGFDGAFAWGRAIFHVSDVDTLYRRALEAGLHPATQPRNAEWGEPTSTSRIRTAMRSASQGRYESRPGVARWPQLQNPDNARDWGRCQSPVAFHFRLPRYAVAVLRHERAGMA